MPIKSDYFNGKLFTDTRTSVTFKIDPELIARARKYAIDNKCPVWTVLGDAIKQFLDTKEK
jgi:predicted transcriptional regulator